MNSSSLIFIGLLLLSFFSGAVSQEAALPPSLPWSGKSEQLVLPANHRWITPAEKSGFEETPRYEATIQWLKKLCAASPWLRMISIGKSSEGRDIWMVIATKTRAFSPAALKKSGKPLFLAQAGIHAGEIDGKDAGLMLLRDMTVVGTKKHLLDRANFLFIPIFNVDGHERFSAYGRVNQRGPKEMGWRTNARNLNLNRDFAKLDTQEMRALVRTMQSYDPDFFADIHVTDGMDHQYDITIFYNPPYNSYSPASSTWIQGQLQPALFKALADQGHIPGLYVGDFLDNDLKKGILDGFESPRYSSGYGSSRHIPSILVETHSLKPYKQRVLGTYVLLEAILKTLGEQSATLRSAIQTDRTEKKQELILDWDSGKPTKETREFLAVESTMLSSPVTKTDYEQWLGKPTKRTVPVVRTDVPKAKISKPKAYIVPGNWPELIERLKIHGIQMQTLRVPKKMSVEMYRLIEPQLSSNAFEGHVGVSISDVKPEKRTETFYPGSVRIPTDQPLGDLLTLLLEPQSPDSFFQWGFMHEILQATEYMEEYVMQPLAEKMLEKNPALKTEFEQKKKTDKTFAKDTKAQLDWLYRKTPYADDRWLLYPVARELEGASHQ